MSANRVGAQDLQNVPLAITALDTATLERSGLQSLADITRNTPGITVQERGGGVNNVVIRGIVTEVDTSNTYIESQQAVSIYLDDTPISLTGLNPDLRIYDLERVEVIRGPQGTLYGAGAMAGNIRYITRKPDSKAFDASMEISGSTTKGNGGYDKDGSGYGFRGMVNEPLIDDALALRASVYQGRDPGYIDNIGTHKAAANWQDTTQVRLALRYETEGPLTADASYIFARNETGGSSAASLGSGLRYTSSRPESFLDKFHLLNLTLNYRADLFDVISSTSYTYRDTYLQQSGDRIVQGVLGFETSAWFEIPNKIKDFSQELRLASKAWDHLKAQVGVFFEDQKWDYAQDFRAAGLDAFLSAATGVPVSSVDDYFSPHADSFYYQTQNPHTRQISVFGEATYSPTQRLDLTVGLRRFHWRQTYSQWTAGFSGVGQPPDFPATTPLSVNGESTEQGTNPKFNATYHLSDDVMVFAEAAKGFRYGGINGPMPMAFCADDLIAEGVTTVPVAYGPDYVWTYSLGEKARLADGRMTLNTTAFLTDWSDVQTMHQVGCGFGFTRNKGQVRSTGVELETQLQATRALQISLSASYTHAVTHGPLEDLGAPDGARAPYFPKVMATVQGVYEWPLSLGTLLLQADYGYRGNMTNSFNAADAFYRVVPAQNVVNAAMVLKRGQTDWTLYGRNLTDERVIFAHTADVFEEALYRGRPLTFGVKFGMHF